MANIENFTESYYQVFIRTTEITFYILRNFALSKKYPLHI